MTMRERVARAMFAKMMASMKTQHPVAYEDAIIDETWEACAENTRENWLACADVGLDALMVPTNEMIEAAANWPDAVTITDVFQAMIRAASEPK